MVVGYSRGHICAWLLQHGGSKNRLMYTCTGGWIRVRALKFLSVAVAEAWGDQVLGVAMSVVLGSGVGLSPAKH